MCPADHFLGSQSWTVGGPHLSVASNAVFSHRSGNYAAIVSDANIGRQKALFWSDSFTGTLLSVPTAVTLQLRCDTAVSALFPHPGSSCKYDFIAVLEDCTILLLDSAAGSFSKLYGHSGMTTMSTSMDDTSLYVMARTAHREFNGNSDQSHIQPLMLLSFPFDSSSSEEMWSAPIKPQQKASTLQSFAIHGATLTCVWSDGSVTISSLSPVRGVRTQHFLEIPAASIGQHSPQTLTSKKRRNHETRNGSHAIQGAFAKTQVVAPHENCAIIFSPEVASQGVRYVVISTLFGAPISDGHIQAEAPLLSRGASLLAAAAPPAAGHQSSNDVLLGLGGRLVRAVISVPPPSLAGAVGTLVPVRERKEAAVLSADCLQRQQNSCCIRPLSHTDVHTGTPARKNGAESGSGSSGNFIRRVPSPWALSQNFSDEELNQTLRAVALSTGPIEREDKLKKLLCGLGSSSMVVTGGMLEKLADRLLEGELWPLLEQLIRLRPPLSLPRCHAMLATCANAGQYHLLACLMREASDVDLVDFSNMLRELTAQAGGLSADAHLQRQGATAIKGYAHGTAVKLCAQAEAKKLNLQSCQAAAAAVSATEGFSGVQITLHAVVACRLDEVEVRDACRALDSTRAEHLFVYLQRWLEEMLGQRSGAWFDEAVWCVSLSHSVQMQQWPETWSACSQLLLRLRCSSLTVLIFEEGSR